nr:protein tincar-like [Dermacentor andersoni]
MCVEAGGRRQLKNGPGPLNTLASLWHCVAALALSAATVVHSVGRFPELAALSPPVELLHAYVALVGVGVLLLPFVAAAALVRVGNLANDGLVLDGDDEDEVKRSLPRLCWRHGPPTAAALHAASALCLLLPRLMADAAFVRYGLRPTGDVWRTDLDVVMSPRERQTAFFAANLLAESPSDAEPPSVEFVNYVLALVVCALRYPSVVWDAKRRFALLFAFYLALCAGQRILLFPAASVLYKAHIAGVVPPSLLTDSATLLVVLVAHGGSVALSGPALYCAATLDRRRGASVGLLLVLLVLAALSGAPLAHDLVRAYASSRDCLLAAAAAAVTAQWIVWSAAAMLLLAPKKAPPPPCGCEKKRTPVTQRPVDDEYATLLDVWRPESDEAGPSVPWISHHHRHSQEERLLGRATVTRLTSFRSDRDSSLYSEVHRVT